MKELFFKNQQKRPKKSSILILSVWTLSFLGLLAFFSSAYVRQQILTLRRLEQRKDAYFLAKSAVFFAIESTIEKKDENKKVDFLGSFWADRPDIFKNIVFNKGRAAIQHEAVCSFGRKQGIRYGLLDEERKININHVRSGIIKNLLIVAAGLEPEDAHNLAREIIDWRDSDDLKSGGRIKSGPSAAYSEKSDNYTLKNPGFKVLEEVLLVDGMNGRIFFEIEELITVYSAGKVNINTAGKKVLRSLGLSDQLADKIIYYRAGPNLVEGDRDDNFFSSTKNMISDLENFTDLSSGEKKQLENLIAKNILTVSSNTFFSSAAAELDNGAAYGKIDFVFDLDGNIYYWRVY